MCFALSLGTQYHDERDNTGNTAYPAQNTADDRSYIRSLTATHTGCRYCCNCSEC